MTPRRFTAGDPPSVRIATVVFLQVMVLVFAFTALAYLRQFDLSGFDLGPSPEALAREQELLALGRLAVEALEPVRIDSEPGQPIPWTQLVRASRTFHYDGDQRTTCRQIVVELTARGLTLDQDEPECDRPHPGTEWVTAAGRVNCGDYEMSVDVTVYSHSYEPFPSTVRVELTAPYPGTGAAHTLPELQPTDCIAGSS